MSTALTLLKQVWNHGKKDSWERINNSMRNALSLAVGSGLKFDASDFSYMTLNFRWAYWISDAEWVYKEAVINGNESCESAFESWKGRKPFRGNNVTVNRWDRGGYIHTNGVHRQRERLAINFGFPALGRQWWVTGFDDTKGVIRVASYAKHWQEGKPKKLMSLTHEKLSELCPAPKKPSGGRGKLEQLTEEPK